MKTQRTTCSVCGKWFDNDDGLASCPAHSFGEMIEIEQNQETGEILTANGIALSETDKQEQP